MRKNQKSVNASTGCSCGAINCSPLAEPRKMRDMLDHLLGKSQGMIGNAASQEVWFVTNADSGEDLTHALAKADEIISGNTDNGLYEYALAYEEPAYTACGDWPEICRLTHLIQKLISTTGKIDFWGSWPDRDHVMELLCKNLHRLEESVAKNRTTPEQHQKMVDWCQEADVFVRELTRGIE